MSAYEVSAELETKDDYPLLRAGPDCPYRTETFNLWAYDPAAGIGLGTQFVATGGDFSSFVANLLVFEGGDILVDQVRGGGLRPEGPGAGNAFATNLEPFKRWRYEFLGMLPRTSSRQSARAQAGLAPEDSAPPAVLVSYNLSVDILTPPVEQGSQGDRGRTASSGTIPRTALRYEQLCRVRGALRLGKREIELDARGMRSHRRNSAGIYESGAVGHTWAAGLFPSGRGFHLLSYRHEPDSAARFRYGYWFDGERYHDAEVVKFPHYSGATEAERYELELRVGKRSIRIQGEGIAPMLSNLPQGPGKKDVRLGRSPGRFVMEGEIGGGIFERSLRSDLPAGGEFVALGSPSDA
jgi:hypothetical protein